MVTVVAWIAGATVSGWPSLYVAILFLGAVQLLCLGLLGEYVARIYTAVQGRPAYFVAADSATVGDEPTARPTLAADGAPTAAGPTLATAAGVPAGPGGPTDAAPDGAAPATGPDTTAGTTGVGTGPATLADSLR